MRKGNHKERLKLCRAHECRQKLIVRAGFITQVVDEALRGTCTRTHWWTDLLSCGCTAFSPDTHMDSSWSSIYVGFWDHRLPSRILYCSGRSLPYHPLSTLRSVRNPSGRAKTVPTPGYCWVAGLQSASHCTIEPIEPLFCTAQSLVFHELSFKHFTTSGPNFVPRALESVCTASLFSTMDKISSG